MPETYRDSVEKQWHFFDGNDEINAKMGKLEGKECKIDFNDPTDDDEIIIPKRLIVN